MAVFYGSAYPVNSKTTEQHTNCRPPPNLDRVGPGALESARRSDKAAAQGAQGAISDVLMAPQHEDLGLEFLRMR